MSAKDELDEILRNNKTWEDATAAIRRKRKSLFEDPTKSKELDAFDLELENVMPSVRGLPRKASPAHSHDACVEAERRADAAMQAASEAENTARRAIDLAKTALSAVEMVASARTRAKKDEVVAQLRGMILAGTTSSRGSTSSQSS
jgi:hypothetical protein